MGVIVGLDCGGSSSRVLAVDRSDSVVFQGQSGAANLVSTPESRLRRNLRHATDGCPKADFVCACFAGLVGDETREQALDVLREIFPAARLRVEPDYVAALYAAERGDDLCVISGTGSLVCSRTPKGIVKSGGRGYILGDYGSGFHYGRDALVHFLDHPDRASDALRQEIQRLFHSDVEGVIVTQVYRSSPPSTLLAKLVKALGSDAKAGEGYALESIARNTRALVSTIKRHVERFEIRNRSLSISLAGGVWQAGPSFKEELETQLKEQFRDRIVTVHRITRPPVQGAVRLAKEMSIGNGG